MEGVFDREGDGFGKRVSFAGEFLSPFAEFGMREGAKTVVVDPLEPVEAPGFAGVLVGEEEGVERFGVRPPEFGVGEIPADFGAAEGVDGEEESAVFRVPADFGVAAHEAAGFGDAGGILAVAGDVDLEPHVFDDVAGDDGGACRAGKTTAGGGNAFDDEIEIRLVESGENFVAHRGSGGAVMVVVEEFAEFPEDEGEHHREAVDAGVFGDRIREVGDLVVGLGEAGDDVVGGFAGEGFDFGIAGGFGEFDEAVDREAVDVDAFAAAEGFAVFVEEEFPAADGIVPAVLGGEFVNVSDKIEPFRLPLDLVVEAAKNPDGAPLAPEEFLAIDEGAVVVEAGVEATFRVDGVADPERDDVLQEVVAEGSVKLFELLLR